MTFDAKRWAVCLVLLFTTLGVVPVGGIGGDSVAFAGGAEAGHPLTLHVRRRVETSDGSDRFHAVTEEVQWDPAKTAIVVCDMWNRHWCKSATRRVAQMADRMNDVLTAARDKGVLIIHAPSGTMDFYRDTPQRQRAMAAPIVETEMPLLRWCHLDPQREGPSLPIDDADGGCDCQPPCEQGRRWSRQIETIEIAEADAITDSAEAFYLMRERGIENVIVMGVHTNMCVLGRPFSIRQMVRQGQNVVLMRDMTDTMYNPRSRPFVSHFTGTDLVVEHIEKHWCPTVTSADFLGGREFRFPDDNRPHLAILMAEREYETNRTLPAFAAAHLGRDFRVSLVFGNESDRTASPSSACGGRLPSSAQNSASSAASDTNPQWGNDLPGIDVLEEADLVLISVRRRVLPKPQLDLVRKFFAAGKPVIGIRTASHAFSLRGNQPIPPGHDAWPTFDPEVFGGHYVGHHGNDVKVAIELAPDAADHPILANVAVKDLIGNGSLYRVRPLADSAKPLLIGTIPGQQSEPVAWTHRTKAGGRVFYTSLGHPNDFENEAFVRMLDNGIHWAAGLAVHEPEAAVSEAE